MRHERGGVQESMAHLWWLKWWRVVEACSEAGGRASERGAGWLAGGPGGGGGGEDGGGGCGLVEGFLSAGGAHPP